MSIEHQSGWVYQIVQTGLAANKSATALMMVRPSNDCASLSQILILYFVLSPNFVFCI